MRGDARFGGRYYRYSLSRQWDRHGGTVLFILLNPSTANAHEDDPTIRRCIAFARRWGFGRLVVANLFARRATKPGKLRQCRNPVGPENDAWLKRLAAQADLIVAGWGNGGLLFNRANLVADALPPLHCLGVTMRGMPRHPLYVRADEHPRPWKRGPRRRQAARVRSMIDRG